MKFSSIALRTLIHDKRRYIMLFIAASIGIALTLSSSGLLNGMMNSLYNKARIYYGGDAMLLSHYIYFSNPDDYIQKIEDTFNKKGYIISKRINYELESYFYFEGTSIKQRKLFGVDFKKEKPLFDTLNFVSGGTEGMQDSNGVLISSQLAELLNVAVGDNITVMVKTDQNYTNTANAIVKGIFQDSSLFGMNVSYFDRDYLAYILNEDPNSARTIGIFSKTDVNKTLSEKKLKKMYSYLCENFNMYHYTQSKDEFLYDSNQYRSPKEASKIALISLDANLSDIKFLIDAMHIIIYLIMAVLILIIAIGIGSTYKVIAVKRTNEIGIYMALGMSSAKIVFLFLIEAFYLITASFIFGLALTGINCLIFNFIDFSAIPNFDIFLTNTHLLLQLSLWQTILIYVIICFITVLLVFLTIRKTANITPVDALSVAE